MKQLIKPGILFSAILVAGCSSLGSESTPRSEFVDVGNGFYRAHNTNIAPTIDGLGDELAWENATWSDMNYVWQGSVTDASDFSGKFKIIWDENKIYILAEITDDVINNSKDELSEYWMGDCIEIFIDENKSGGSHQYSHNAFAYHISHATQNAYDMSTDRSAAIFDHVTTAIVQDGDIYRWEMAIDVYDDTYTESKNNIPLLLTSGKLLGFTLAYCDNDTGSRNAFIGSKSRHGVNNDEGYINADVFGTLELVE